MRFPLALIAFIMPWILSVVAQPPASVLNGTDAKGRKQGSWSKTWPNGKTRYLGQFKDDLPFGSFKHYDEFGVLTTVQEHVGDGKVSRARHFHANGTLMATGKYVGQEKDSTWNYFGEDGKLRRVERFQTGKLHGEQVSYYSNGTVAERETRENGLLHGPNKSWFENGNPKIDATYVKDHPEGRMTFYFPSGKKEIEGLFVNGDRDGTWYYFNADASIQLQILYAKGLLVKERKENGTFKEYFDDEQIRSEVTYKKGKREGPSVDYFNNGTWEMRPLLTDPMIGGPPEMERVLVGQTRKRESVYVNDKLEGEVKEYSETGKVVLRTKYKAGVMVP